MRVRPLARRLGTVALVGSLSLGIAACQSGSDDERGTDDSSSSTGTDSGDGDSGDGDGDADSGDASELEELSAEEFYTEVMGALRDEETFAMETTSTANGQSTTIRGEARYGEDSVSLKAASEGAGEEAMEMILLDKMLYINSPTMGTDGKWLKVDLSDESSLFGMLGKSLDPDSMMQALEAPKELELIGEEEVEGVATNHYRIVMDPEAYVEAMELPAGVAEYMPDELVTEMWVDADNRPRKFTQSITTPSTGNGPETTTDTEGYYRDFGLDVDIEAPADDEIVDQPGFPAP